jgi:hypothetical protein
MADIFYVDQATIDAWKPIYERSLARASNALVKDEIKLALKTELGRTRRIVNRVVKLTRQVDGRAFLDTPEGKKLEDFAGSQIFRSIVRIAKVAGIPIAGVYHDQVLQIAKNAAHKFMQVLVGDDDGTKKPASTPIKRPDVERRGVGSGSNSDDDKPIQSPFKPHPMDNPGTGGTHAPDPASRRPHADPNPNPVPGQH